MGESINFAVEEKWLFSCQGFLRIRPAERQQEARGKVVIQSPPSPTFRLWPMRQKEFHSGLRPLRHFEEFLRIRPLQSEAPQSTRPWGDLPPYFSAGLSRIKKWTKPQTSSMRFFVQLLYQITSRTRLKTMAFICWPDRHCNWCKYFECIPESSYSSMNKNL